MLLEDKKVDIETSYDTTNLNIKAIIVCTFIKFAKYIQ